MQNKSTMKKEEKKSEIEKKWAKIFFSFINKKYNFDYSAKSLPNTIPVVDVEGVSISGKFPKLKTELTLAIEWAPEELGLTKKNIKSGFGYFDNNQIQNSIDKKICKYNKKRIDINGVILLIQGKLNYNWMNDYIIKLKEKNISSPFKGIYYIYLDDTKNTSFVLSIKKAF